jgi:uncharacterized OsmC-like protein
MAGPQELKTIYDRNEKALRLRPGIGQGTATTTVRIRGGLACDIEDGPWKLVADEMPGDGGGGLGPDPGVLVRAGLGSCLAIGYVISAARMDIPLDSVEVTVEADYDARGMYALDENVPPGWTGIRYITHIASAAEPQRIRELVEFADRHSSILDGLRRAVPVAGELRIESAPAPVGPGATDGGA